MKWLLNIIYATLLTCVSPVILWRSLRHGRYRRGWAQKLLGRLPVPSTDRPVVWFHAVSVGEVVQLQKVVEAFRRDTQDEFNIVLTTSTDTGYELAITRFPDCTVTWFPLDFSWAVNAALSRINPTMVVLMELELWPNLLTACQQRGIATTLINARLSDRSFPGYMRVKRLLRPILEQFSVVAAQSEEYAERLRKIGCVESKLHVTGSVKFDGAESNRENAATMELRRLFNIQDDDIVLIAGSTQAPEEDMALNAWRQLRESHPGLRLIIVPRHQERFHEVADLIVDSGVPLVRRSQLTTDANTSGNEAVLLLDTIGELGACWGLADIAFVGGTFGPRGGQNMLEPAAYGAAITFGPNTWNFRDIVARLNEQNAAIVMSTTDEFAKVVKQLLDDPFRRRQLGLTARSVVESHQGAIQNTVHLLTATVDSAGTDSDSRIAA